MVRDFQHLIDPTLSARENFKRIPEGIRAEVIDDKLYVSPTPTTYHQDVCHRLFMNLATYVERHKLGIARCVMVDVYLRGKKDTVVPDIVFISKRNRKLKIQRRGYFGPPDLAVEILSSNKNYDRIIKKRAYERAGIREYWIIDPLTKQAEGYRLRNRRYGKPLIMHSEINVRILKKAFRF